MKKNRRAKTTPYLQELVDYGGQTVTRGAMIRDLQKVAASTGHPNPQALVDRYLQGHALKERTGKPA